MESTKGLTLMKILVTGGLGFQGSHLVEALVKEGHEVTALTTHSERAFDIGHEMGIGADSFHPKLRVVWGSITDREIVNKTVRDQDAVYHLAARMQVDESIRHPRDYVETNVLGTLNILEAVRNTGARLIHVSTCEVYGDKYAYDQRYEYNALFPNSPYAASKVAADRLVYSYFITYAVNAVIARPANVYGPRQRKGVNGNVIPIFVGRAMNNKPIQVYGTGKQSREFIHVDDVVKAYELLLKKGRAGEVFNIGSGEQIKIIDIACDIANSFGVEVKHVPPREGEVKQFILNSDKAKKQLGWEATIPFDEGLEHYVYYAQNQR